MLLARHWDVKHPDGTLDLQDHILLVSVDKLEREILEVVKIRKILEVMKTFSYKYTKGTSTIHEPV